MTCSQKKLSAQIKKDERGGSYSMHGKKGKHIMGFELKISKKETAWKT